MYEKLLKLYPSLTQQDFLTVIILQNDSDGRGDYIKEWNHPTLSKPTDEQLSKITALGLTQAEVTALVG
jgi:hypothetical protein